MASADPAGGIWPWVAKIRDVLVATSYWYTVALAASDLAEDGWIPVDPATFATKFPGVFAVGDVTSAPVPRAGGIAEGEAATVAEVLISQLTDGSIPPPYDGAAACYVELGVDLVARIDVNFLSYDRPVATFSAPTAARTQAKREWGSTRAARWFGSDRVP